MDNSQCRRLVFVSDGSSCPPPQLDKRYHFFLWRPGMFRIVPPALPRRYASLWLQHILHIYQNRDCCTLYIMDQETVIHRTCVIPKNFRFLFMEPCDVQISPTWTHPDYRNQGLGRAGLSQVLALLQKPGRRFWYAVRENNPPSIALCTKIGFTFVGYQKAVNWRGTRVKQYTLESAAHL